MSVCLYVLSEADDGQNRRIRQTVAGKRAVCGRSKKEFEKFDMTQYNEVVFCGFGEPTERFDALKEIAAFVKEKYNKPIRINTNGAGSLINGRDIAPELKGLVDTVSVSLNHPEKRSI